MRWYKKLLAVLCVFGVIALFIFFGLRIQKVNVEGTEIYTEEEIKQSVFSRKYSDNELFFAIYSKIYGINKLPFVEDIEVTYDNMNTVTLHVYDKTISGCIKYMGQYVYFDKDGIVLQSMQEKRDGVPVVTGIQFGTFTIGEAFQVKDDTLFQSIMNLSQQISHHEINVKRIHVEEETISLYSGNVKVLLERKEQYDDELSALSSVLETTEEKNLSGTIDMQGFESGDKIILKQSSSGKQKNQKKSSEN
ncbi:MAG: cell division protein FtsQ/DivIB [Clostridiaceae bacterium]|nr:cell division protein FtsQ/DivIB [Clostridiaceae bacterium]